MKKDYYKLTIEDMYRQLRIAAEEIYKLEMEDTNMAVLEIEEVAGAYEHYENDEEKQIAIQNCTYESKEDWIQDKLTEWLNTI